MVVVVVAVVGVWWLVVGEEVTMRCGGGCGASVKKCLTIESSTHPPKKAPTHPRRRPPTQEGIRWF